MAIVHIDVLVIGLGPGGAAAAKSAASAGARVLAVEKKKSIGSPVQCAEFIPLPMSAYAAGEPIRVQSISGMKSILPSGRVAKTDFPGLMIDRQAFDAAIAEAAKQQGASLMTHARLIDLDIEQSIAKIAHGDAVLEVRFGCLVAADGPHSPTAKLLGLPPLETVNTRQYTVPLLKPYADTDVWLDDEYPGGYAWLFPKGKVANLGLGADSALCDDLKQPLDHLHQRLVANGLVGEEILARTGGAIPVSGLRENVVVKNIVFVGDAAGLTHPITGAGISAAVLSGDAAGIAAARFVKGDVEALVEYEEELRDQYEVSLKRAVEKRRWLNQYWHTPQAKRDDVQRAGWIAFSEYFDDKSRETNEQPSLS